MIKVSISLDYIVQLPQDPRHPQKSMSYRLKKSIKIMTEQLATVCCGAVNEITEKGEKVKSKIPLTTASGMLSVSVAVSKDHT